MLKPEFILGKSDNISRYPKYLEAWIILFLCEASTVVMASSKLDLCSCILSVVSSQYLSTYRGLHLG